MSDFLTCGEVEKYLQYYVANYFMSQRIVNDYEEFSKFADDFNLDHFADQYERATDAFIHKIVAMIDGSPEEVRSVVESVSFEIHLTFLMRLMTVTEYLEKDPSKPFPCFGEEKQLLIDCLINFWRDFRKPGLFQLFK